MAASQNSQKYPTMPEVKIINHLYIILPIIFLFSLFVSHIIIFIYLFIFLALGAG